MGTTEFTEFGGAVRCFTYGDQVVVVAYTAPDDQSLPGVDTDTVADIVEVLTITPTLFDLCPQHLEDCPVDGKGSTHGFGFLFGAHKDRHHPVTVETPDFATIVAENT